MNGWILPLRRRVGGRMRGGGQALWLKGYGSFSRFGLVWRYGSRWRALWNLRRRRSGPGRWTMSLRLYLILLEVFSFLQRIWKEFLCTIRIYSNARNKIEILISSLLNFAGVSLSTGSEMFESKIFNQSSQCFLMFDSVSLSTFAACIDSLVSTPPYSSGRGELILSNRG